MSSTVWTTVSGFPRAFVFQKYKTILANAWLRGSPLNRLGEPSDSVVIVSGVCWRFPDGNPDAASCGQTLRISNARFLGVRILCPASGHEWGPYPLGLFAKGMDGRIDDLKAGWKGKGLWTTWGTRTPFHSEMGKGTTSKVVHFRIRPDPLAN